MIFKHKKNALMSRKYFFFSLTSLLFLGKDECLYFSFHLYHLSNLLPFFSLRSLFGGFLSIPGNSLRFTVRMWEREQQETVGRGLKINVSELPSEWSLTSHSFKKPCKPNSHLQALYAEQLRSYMLQLLDLKCEICGNDLDVERWSLSYQKAFHTCHWARNYPSAWHGTKKQASWPNIMQDLT